MRFTDPEIGYAAPAALETLDLSLGTVTRDAYKWAIKIEPRLNGLAVLLADAVPNFESSTLGIAGSRVNLSPHPDYYDHRLEDGSAYSRLRRIIGHLGEKGIEFTRNELIVSIMLHEMGHASDFAELLDANGGNGVLAQERVNRDRERELSTLPLGGSTALAIQARENNIDGYRDRLAEKGIDSEKWEELVAENRRQYQLLPSERYADDFAIGVLSNASK